MQRLYAALTGLAVVMLPLAAQAVTAKDVQVAGRVLNFVATPPTGSVKLGIVYDPANPSSTADEKALLAILGTGLTVGTFTLVPVPISLDKIVSTPADVFFLTSGLGGAAAAVSAQAEKAKTLCITTDLAATQAGYCAVSIQTDPKVQITINKAAASASSGGFASAFMMMVTEI